MPATLDALEKRRAGITPNFELVHECVKCGCKFLCPDRYVATECGPSTFAEEHGWPLLDQSCLPCNAAYDEDDRAIWYEANGVAEETDNENASTRGQSN